MAEMEFRDDAKAIKEERKAWLRYAKAKAAAQAKIIEADAARELAERISAANREHAQDLIDLAVAKYEEKMQSAIEEDREEARRVFSKYVEEVSAKFKAAVQDEGKWREQVGKRVKKIQGDINRSTVRAERLKLLERGAVRGRR